MKKKILTLLITTVLLVSATGILIPNAISKSKASDSTDATITTEKNNKVKATDTNKKKIRYKIIMSTNYYTPKYCKQGVLHYGVNGWQDVKEQDMERTGSFQYGTGVFTTYYTYETIITVNEGDTIDYCFKFITWQDREGWINNGNNDYHVHVLSSNVPCSYTVEYDKTPEEAAQISKIELCYSLDSWNTVKYDKMDYHSIVVNDKPMRNYFDVTVHGYETDSLEYCYKIYNNNGNIEWDNNNGSNYYVPQLKEIED